MEQKIVIVGGVNVGKTALVQRLAHNMFLKDYKATIGLNAVTLPNNIVLYDIAGQEYLTSLYYKDAIGAFVVTDITQPLTLEMAKRWKKDLDDKLPDKPVFLLINKCDLDTDTVDYDAFCHNHGFKKWIRICVKDGLRTTSLISDMLKLGIKTPPVVAGKNNLTNQEISVTQPLSCQLYANTSKVVEERKRYVDEHYEDLQAHVVDFLLDQSRTNEEYKYTLTVNNLYVSNNDDNYEIPLNTVLGKKFSPPTKPSCPTSSELVYLTNKLIHYLISQGLTVIYKSPCCIKIRWD